MTATDPDLAELLAALSAAAAAVAARAEALDAGPRPPEGYDGWMQALRAGTAATLAARSAAETAENATKRLLVGAMRAGIAEHRPFGWRSAVTKASPFTPPTVRALADANGIPPDRRYTRTRTAPASAPPSPAGPDRQPTLPPAVRALSAPAAHRAARLAEERAEGKWAARVRSAHPDVNPNWYPYLFVAAALEEGLLTDADLAG